MHGIFVYAFAEQAKFFIISCLRIKFLSSCCVASKDLKKRLHGAKKSGVRVVFGVFLALKSPSPKLTILLYYIAFATWPFLPIFKILLFSNIIYSFFSRLLHATPLSRFSSSRSNYVSIYVCISSSTNFLRFVSCTQSEKLGDND